MSNLSKLINRCKCGVHVTVNSHKDYYETIEEWVNEEDIEDIADDVWNRILATNSYVRLQFYPDTPVGCYVIHHYDVDKAIEEGLKVLDNEV